MGIGKKLDFFAKKPSASDQAKSPHSTERTVANALCGMQALGVFTAATKLVVSSQAGIFVTY
jgi:hypothetical protein